MDRHCIDCAREEMGEFIPSGADAVLLIEVDGDADVTEREMDEVRDICLRSGAIRFDVASDGEEAENLWEIRRNISETILKLGPHKISEDIVVPRSRMAEYIDFLNQLGQKYRLPMPAFGHAGDGNIHVNIMHDKKRPQDAANAGKAVEEIFRKVIDMGGTISGEHGVGITKAPYFGMEISRPAIELMTRLKKAFDPQGILNPGKILPGA
jgi:glycolate oxidase